MKALLSRLWHSPTLTTWGSLGVRLSGVVLVLPLVLVRFAPAEIAVWQLFATLFTLVLLIDFGLSPTFSRLLAYARGGASVADMADMPNRRGVIAGELNSAIATATRVFGTLRWLYPRLGVFAVLTFGVLGTLALERPIAQTADPATVWLAWAFVLAASGIGFWGNAYAAALQGMDSIAPLRRWEVATGLAQSGTSLAVLAAGGDLLALVFSYQVWVVFNAWRNRRLLRSLHPSLFSRPAARDSEVLRIIWPPTWRSGIGMLMSHGVIQASGLIYAQLAPAAEVAAYLLALRVMTVISQFAQAPFYSKLPGLATAHVRGDTAGLRSMAQRAMRISHWAYVLGVLAVAFLGKPALDLIGSQTRFIEPGVWALMCLGFFAERYGAMHLQLYSLTNHIVWHIANGVAGLLMIFLAWFGYPVLRQYAFSTAMLAADAGFYSVYAVRLSASAYGLKLGPFEIRAALLPVIVLSVALLVFTVS